MTRQVAWVAVILAATAVQLSTAQETEERARAREIGVDVGFMRTGPLNAITDVAGVMVGHRTIVRGDNVRTGVTAILPHPGNLYQKKVPAAIHLFNAYGKLAGYTQVKELGNIETPIILTNTLSVGTAMTAVVEYSLRQVGNERVRSVNPVVGETNDSTLNDIRGLHVTRENVIRAIKTATTGPVEEGSVGAGTGTGAFGYKGGIGTSSRLTPKIGGASYTVGVLVQSNFGRTLNINGVPFSRETRQPETEEPAADRGGSCMIVIATDAPLSTRNLERLAKRAFIGMGRTNSVMMNGSGDYAIAFSTAYRIPHRNPGRTVRTPGFVDNAGMTTLFQAVEEATQEAIYNSLFMATTTVGYLGRSASAIPLDQVRALLEKYDLGDLQERLTWSPFGYD